MDEFDRAWLTDMLDHAELSSNYWVRGMRTHLKPTSGPCLQSAMPFRRLVKLPLMCRDGEDVIGMRHRLVHGYRTRSALVIAETVREHLPTMIATVRRALEDNTP
jgi:hypothetical protein